MIERNEPFHPDDQIMSRYEIIAPIGENKAGDPELYKACDSKKEKLVVLRIGPTTCEQGKRRFRQELWTWSKAIAPPAPKHVMPMVRSELPDGRPFAVMDFMEGGDLEQFLETEFPDVWGRVQSRTPLLNDPDVHTYEAYVAKAIVQICHALQAIHARGIVHRDVKPTNVLVSQDGEDVLLSDFGIARGITANVRGATATAEFLGTLSYMAPEQVYDPKNVQPSADSFAVGQMICRLLTGTRRSQSELQKYFAEHAEVDANVRGLLRTADACVAYDPRHRLTASQVAKRIECRSNGPNRSLSRLQGAMILAVFITIGATTLQLWTTHSGNAGSGQRQLVLSDGFDDSWFNGKLWNAPRPGIREADGYVQLTNRAYMVTVEKFRHPIEVSLKWRWLALRDDPQYADHLSIVVRSSGRVHSQHSYRPMDGIIVNIDAQVGAIQAWERWVTETGSESMTLGSTENDSKKIPMQLSRPLEAPIALPSNEWHSIRVIDDGQSIAVYVSALRDDATDPVLQVRCTDRFDGGHIQIFNREMVGGVPHESHIDNVRVYKLTDIEAGRVENSP